MSLRVADLLSESARLIAVCPACGRQGEIDLSSLMPETSVTDLRDRARCGTCRARGDLWLKLPSREPEMISRHVRAAMFPMGARR